MNFAGVVGLVFIVSLFLLLIWIHIKTCKILAHKDKQIGVLMSEKQQIWKELKRLAEESVRNGKNHTSDSG